MSVLIKGMEMPTNCDDCFLPLRYCPYAMKPDGDCPLVPVPPHGRLIDADALIEKLNALPHRHDTKMVGMVTNEELFDAITYDLTKEPTIIPADPAEEGDEKK